MEAGRIGGGEERAAIDRFIACGSKEGISTPLSRFPKGESRGGRVPPTPQKRRLPPQEGKPPCAIPQKAARKILLDRGRPSHGSLDPGAMLRFAGGRKERTLRRRLLAERSRGPPCKKGRGPLVRGLVLHGQFGRVVLVAVGVRAVENADGVGFQFDDELRNHVLDGFLAVGDFDGAVVFAGAEFALYEDVCAFDQTICQLRKAFTEGDDVVPRGFVFPFVVLVLPGLLGSDAEL